MQWDEDRPEVRFELALIMRKLSRTILAAGKRSHSLHEFLIGVLRGQRHSCRPLDSAGRWSEESVSWNIPADDGAGFDDGSFADANVGQDNAVRTDEDIFLDDDGPFVLIATRSPVEMREDCGAKSDGAVIADGDSIGMAVVHVNEMREPDVLADLNSAHPMQPGPQTSPARTNEGQDMKNTT